MKILWVVLAVILIAIILNPPGSERRSKTDDKSPDLERRPKTDDKPTPVAPPFHPNAVAKSLSAAPGAIVCSDFASVGLVFDLYNAHWEDSMLDAMTKGQSRVLRGQSAPAPDPTLYGCSLLKPGTPVEVRSGEGLLTGIPMVTAKLPDGEMIHGVTLPAMLSRL
jgi:hypothetical protein